MFFDGFDEADAVALIFGSMMRHVLRTERVGEDTLGRTVDLAREWGTSPTADARLAAALRELHGEHVDTDDPRQVADEATPILAENGVLPEADARGAASARFAANARRLRERDITPAEFEELMGGEAGRMEWDPRWELGD
ncbi:MAG: hypothetical protein WA890_27645 [Micromonospora sp.]